jgi:DNA polymerase-1
MKIVIDFETTDWGIQDGIGSGWAFGAVQVLGCGIKVEDGPTEYVTDLAKVVDVCSQADTIIAHNAQYEAGILCFLGVDISRKQFFCTKIGAKLEDNDLFDYSLDTLAITRYNEGKETNRLIEVGAQIGLYTLPENYLEDGKKMNTLRNKCKKIAMHNLDAIQEASPVVAEYCIQDVDLTARLHADLLKTVGEAVYAHYCKLINVVTAMRAKGIRVDIKKTYEVRSELKKALRSAERDLWCLYGHFNYNSPVQVKKWAKEHLQLSGIKDDEGKESFGKEFIEKNEDVLGVRLLGECKKLSKLESFCKTVIEHEKNGRVHPELNIMQARTGRFSCTSPNVQQIPGRDKIWAPKLRSLFLPEEGEEWYSLDFSSQEPRLQVHYAEAIGSVSGKELAQTYRLDPRNDIYTTVCEEVKRLSGVEMTRSQSKVMTLALSYGMGADKGAKALGVSVREYNKIKKAYFQGASYLKELNQYCQNKMTERGYIFTLGRRKIQTTPGKEYKALNGLIQGSAFDQTAEALIQAYDAGLLPLTTIHDEIALSSGDIKEAEKLQEIMQTCMKLSVPSVADINKGPNWGEAKG